MGSELAVGVGLLIYIIHGKILEVGTTVAGSYQAVA